MIDLTTIWFLLIGVLITGYAVLDGFDLGVGVLHPFARNDTERRHNLNAIGPVWDGNEVWLLTAGGALFAAFPIVYATVFSGFYLAFMLLVAALVFRATSFEFRGKVDSPRWRNLWDCSFTIGSLLPAVLYGVAVGNILRGIPLAEDGTFTGSFLGLLNPYALLVGLVSLAVFTMHGAAYMCLKVDGEHRERMSGWIKKSWVAFALLFALATAYSAVEAPHLFTNGFRNFVLWLAFVALLIVSVTTVPFAVRAARYGKAFLATTGTIVSMIALAAVGLFPRMVPSSTDLAYSLTIHNASSTNRTLAVMLVITLLGMPLVVGYTIYIYRVFKGKVILTEDSY